VSKKQKSADSAGLEQNLLFTMHQITKLSLTLIDLIQLPAV